LTLPLPFECLPPAHDTDLTGLRAALAADEFTGREPVLFYIARIQRHDDVLASVIELDPDALVEADRLDALHAAGDRLRNTAGAAVLADHVPPHGAFLGDRLRPAGALVLGNWSVWSAA